MFFDLREIFLDCFKDWFFWLFEAKFKAKYGKGLEILIHKQMLQRLATALTNIKPENSF